jgi:hypothetical protein
LDEPPVELPLVLPPVPPAASPVPSEFELSQPMMANAIPKISVGSDALCTQGSDATERSETLGKVRDTKSSGAGTPFPSRKRPGSGGGSKLADGRAVSAFARLA